MDWFRKEKKPRAPVEQKRTKVPEGIWVRCDGCREMLYKKELLRTGSVCPKCNYHFRISARERLESLLDEGRFEEFDAELASVDPLRFRDTKPYRDRLREYRERAGMNDAVINARGSIEGIAIVVSCMEYNFMGGSMGSVVGEKVTRAVERATEERCPLIVISCSGGARMQEGILSLMQ